MSIPKQDERTPDAAPDRNFENAREAWNLVWEREAEISKLKASTEALRSALRELLVATDPVRGRGSDRELDARQQAVSVLCGATISNKEIVRSGSPAPSTEGLREWQLIKTAPKDGTEILTFSDRIGLGNMVLYWADGYWREKANGLGLKYEPTHWMPLPPAPDAARTALAGVTGPDTEDK